MAKGKSGNSTTKHVPGPPIISPLCGGGGDYYQTTITDGDKKFTGYGRTSEESHKNASDKKNK